MVAAIVVFIFFIFAIISFFFSVSETSIIALNKIRLRHMVSQGSRAPLACRI